MRQVLSSRTKKSAVKVLDPLHDAHTGQALWVVVPGQVLSGSFARRGGMLAENTLVHPTHKRLPTIPNVRLQLRRMKMVPTPRHLRTLEWASQTSTLRVHTLPWCYVTWPPKGTSTYYPAYYGYLRLWLPTGRLKIPCLKSFEYLPGRPSSGTVGLSALYMPTLTTMPNMHLAIAMAISDQGLIFQWVWMPPNSRLKWPTLESSD